MIQDFSAFTSATNGIALGPDGNFWVAEEISATVARMTPAGDVHRPGQRRLRADVGRRGPGRDRVGVGDRLQPARPHRRATTPRSRPFVMPWAAPGRDRRWRERAHVLLAARRRAVCPHPDRFDRRQRHRPDPAAGGRRRSSTSPSPTGSSSRPYDGDAVRRYRLGARRARDDASIGAVGSPDGITADGAGNVWVTLNGAGGVGALPGRPERRHRADVPGRRRDTDRAVRHRRGRRWGV